MIQTIKSRTLLAPGSVPSRRTGPESPHEPQCDEPSVPDHNDAAAGPWSLDNSADDASAASARLDGAEVGLERQIEHLIRRLRNDFPQVDPSTIRTLLDEALEHTRHARVQQFRSLLAERTVRDQLQRCSAPSRATRAS